MSNRKKMTKLYIFFILLIFLIISNFENIFFTTPNDSPTNLKITKLKTDKQQMFVT